MELLIERNHFNGGLFTFFEVDGQEYYADIALLFNGYFTECMIFESKDKQVTDWTDLYCRRDIPLTEESLRECVEEFVSELKNNN